MDKLDISHELGRNLCPRQLVSEVSKVFDKSLHVGNLVGKGLDPLLSRPDLGP